MFWPVRCSKGGEMLAPGDGEDPIQVVDVRDLADFIVTSIERKTVGVYNVTGPFGGMPMKQFVGDICRGVGPETKPVWVDSAFLESKSVDGGSFPLWIPRGAEQSGMHTSSVTRAVAAGLTYRDLADTAKATLEWYQGLPEATQQRVVPAMLGVEREGEVISAWRERA